MRHLPALLSNITHRIALPTRNSVQSIRLVIVAEGSHPFPSRTRKLSPHAPMVLPFGGRVGRRQAFFLYPEGFAKPESLTRSSPSRLSRRRAGQARTVSRVVSTLLRVLRTRGTRRVRCACGFLRVLVPRLLRVRALLFLGLCNDRFLWDRSLGKWRCAG